jgi:hypothetical protein
MFMTPVVYRRTAEKGSTRTPADEISHGQLNTPPSWPQREAAMLPDVAGDAFDGKVKPWPARPGGDGVDHYFALFHFALFDGLTISDYR